MSFFPCNNLYFCSCLFAAHPVPCVYVCVCVYTRRPEVRAGQEQDASGGHGGHPAGHPEHVKKNERQQYCQWKKWEGERERQRGTYSSNLKDLCTLSFLGQEPYGITAEGTVHSTSEKSQTILTIISHKRVFFISLSLSLSSL